MVDFDFSLIRRGTIQMLWYIIAINAFTTIRPEVLFKIICSVCIFSAISMIFDTERTLSSYIIEDRRYHSEGEGGDININNICLILVSFAAVASVLKKNIEHMRYSNILIVSLYLSVGVVLLIGATRSALIFFLVLIFYNFFNSYTRVMFKVMFVLILFLIIFSFGIAQFGLDFVFFKEVSGL